MTDDGGIRASDSDRENVVEILRDAYSTGRLTMAEFDERTTAAFAARTWGELRKLTTDLPQQAKLELAHPAPERDAAPSPPRPPLPAGRSRRRLSPMLPILMIWLTVALTTRDPSAFVPVLIILLVLVRLASGGGHRRR
ncbi:MAG TPA: DUF1707 domain-containing protein [Streptosporangiaceae bacterium]|nr:DUF1707 domain-containing protein [Streptosporangiaceae bacterium]